MNKNLGKKVITAAVISTSLLGGMANAAFAATTTSNVPTSNQLKKNSNVGTAIITAKGTLEGQMVSYLSDIPNTGKMTLHYSAKNSGFVDGDISYLTIKMPEQFKYVDVQPEFVNAITGQLRETKIFGDKTQAITPDMVSVYSDRIIIKVPSSFWIGVGDVTADIVLDYGKIIAANPKLPIADAPAGYQFIAQLQYSSAPWDVIKSPIIGTDSNTIYTKETQAIIPLKANNNI